ncbi:MAG: hypothetical protein ABJH05_17610 [Fulvivirga sp.]
MNWKFILTMLPVGPLMGGLMVLGVGVPAIPILWVIASIATAWMLYRKEDKKWLLTVLVLAVLWGITHNVVEAIFFETYVANNPEISQQLTNPDFIPKRYFVLLTGTHTGFGAGILAMALNWVFKVFS